MYQDGVAGGDGPVYAFQDVGLLHQGQELGGLVGMVVHGQSYARHMGFKREIPGAIDDQGKVLGLGGRRVAQEQARHNLVTRRAGDRTGQTEHYILDGERKHGGGAASIHVDPVSTHVALEETTCSFPENLFQGYIGRTACGRSPAPTSWVSISRDCFFRIPRVNKCGPRINTSQNKYKRNIS